jgi:hypothetical protein
VTAYKRLVWLVVEAEMAVAALAEAEKVREVEEMAVAVATVLVMAAVARDTGPCLRFAAVNRAGGFLRSTQCAALPVVMQCGRTLCIEPASLRGLASATSNKATKFCVVADSSRAFCSSRGCG